MTHGNEIIGWLNKGNKEFIKFSLGFYVHVFIDTLAPI